MKQENFFFDFSKKKALQFFCLLGLGAMTQRRISRIEFPAKKKTNKTREKRSRKALRPAASSALCDLLQTSAQFQFGGRRAGPDRAANETRLDSAALERRNFRGKRNKTEKKTRGLWALNRSPLTQIPLRCYVTAGRHGTKRLFSCSSSVVCLRRTDDRSGTAFYAGEKAVGTLFRGAKNNNNNNNN